MAATSMFCDLLQSPSWASRASLFTQIARFHNLVAIRVYGVAYESTRGSKRNCRFARRPDLRIRHRRDLRYHRRAQSGVPPLGQRPRFHGSNRAYRHHRRRVGCRQDGRPVRPQEDAVRHRRPVCPRRAGYRADQRLHNLHDLPVPRRRRRGRSVGLRPHLHGGGGATGGTWSPCRHGPVQHRAGHPAGLRVQRDHRCGRVTRRCLAMDVRRHGRPGRGIPRSVDHCAGDTALVVVRRPRPGGRGRPPATVQHRRRGPVRTARNPRLACSRGERQRRSVLHPCNIAR